MVSLHPLRISKGMTTFLNIQSLESFKWNRSTAGFYLFYHKSYHSCSWLFQKLSQLFTPLFLVEQISWKYYSSNSLISGQMLFHFISVPSSSSTSTWFCGQELLLLSKATVLMGRLKVKIQRKKQHLTQKHKLSSLVLVLLLSTGIMGMKGHFPMCCCWESI